MRVEVGSSATLQTSTLTVVRARLIEHVFGSIEVGDAVTLAHRRSHGVEGAVEG